MTNMKVPSSDQSISGILNKNFHLFKMVFFSIVPIVGDLINFESCEGNVNEEKKI
jgi:hypothetical protein